jgi:hypothetical protein
MIYHNFNSKDGNSPSINNYMPNTIGSISQSILNKTRKDKFIMIVTLPKALREINLPGTRDITLVNENALQFSVYGVTVPQIIVDAVEVPFGGQVFNFTSHNRPDYETISVNFTIDNEFNNYWAIYKWINLLNNNKEAFFYAEKIPVLNNPYDEYATTITVYGLDEYNNRRIQFDYIGAVPVGLGEIAYSHRDGAEAETSFQFAFSQMHVKLLPEENKV